MTNTEIIINEALANGLYTEEQIENILASGHMIPIHTFKVWKDCGYVVKKGEHARITTRLWKFTNKAKKSEEADGKKKIPLPVVEIGPDRKLIGVLWGMLIISVVFGTYKNFTAVTLQVLTASLCLLAFPAVDDSLQNNSIYA